MAAGFFCIVLNRPVMKKIAGLTMNTTTWNVMERVAICMGVLMQGVSRGYKMKWSGSQ